MEFNEKLLELRNQKGLTQEELAQALYVSRTAVSKWESGRGYPSIDSLKAIAGFFSVTIDELLSGDEMLHIAEEDTRHREHQICSLAYALLDCCAAMLLFLPFFRMEADGTVYALPLSQLKGITLYLQAAFLIIVIGMTLWGITSLILQNRQWPLWERCRYKASLILNATGALLMIVSSQPYAASLLFIFLMIKGFLIIKRQ